MFNLIIKSADGKTELLKLTTEDRKQGRSLYFLCRENQLTLESTEEIKPRPVTYKNV